MPILYTLPGGKIAEAYIAKHTQSVGLKTKAFFLNEGESNSSWDKSLILDQNINKTQDEDNPNIIERLNFIAVNKILAYLCAHVSYRHKGTVYFDSDAVEAILDTGCSTTISFELNDFIDYKPMKGKVEGLGVHNIVGTGTVKYTVLDDNGDKVNLLMLIIYQPWTQD